MCVRVCLIQPLAAIYQQNLYVCRPMHVCIYVTDRSFRYASPCLWNQHLISLYQPHFVTSFSFTYLTIVNFVYTKVV